MLSDAQPRALAFDIETYSTRDYETDIYATPAPLYPWLGGEPRLLQFGWEVDGEVQIYYLDTFRGDVDWADMQSVFEHLVVPNLTVVGHNLGFEYMYLADKGIYVRCKTFDTMLAEQILASNLIAKGMGLAPTMKRHFGIELSKEMQASRWDTPELSDEQIEYALNDVRHLIALARSQYKLLRRSKQLEVFNIDCAALPLLAACNTTGIRVDTDLLRSKLMDAEKELMQTTQQVAAAMGIENPNSPAQLLSYFKSRGVNLENTQKKTLEGLTVEQFPQKVQFLRMKELTKTVGTYYENWIKMAKLTGGYVYPNLRMIGADSGRMSCPGHFAQSVPDPTKPRNKGGQNPGSMKTSMLKISATLQGAPAHTRELFIARDGYMLVDADFSAIEVRLAAHVYKDETFRKIILDDLDQHTLMASEIWGVPPEEVTKDQRKIAKTANFALIYACGVYKLRQTLEEATGKPVSEEEAQKVYDAWHRLHPSISRHMKSFKKQDIYELRSIAGRRMMKRGTGTMVNDFGFECSQKMTLYSTDGTNWPIQSSGKDLFAEALAKIWTNLYPYKDDVNYLMLVHDEILLEAKIEVADKVAQIVHNCMTAPDLQRKYLGDLPLASDVQMGLKWSEAH